MNLIEHEKVWFLFLPASIYLINGFYWALLYVSDVWMLCVWGVFIVALGIINPMTDTWAPQLCSALMRDTGPGDVMQQTSLLSPAQYWQVCPLCGHQVSWPQGWEEHCAGPLYLLPGQKQGSFDDCNVVTVRPPAPLTSRPISCQWHVSNYVQTCWFSLSPLMVILRMGWGLTVEMAGTCHQQLACLC